MLEAFGSPIVRVRYVTLTGTPVIEQESEAKPFLGRTGLPQRSQIVAIHRQDMIEAQEIRVLDPTRPQPRQIVAAPRGSFLGTWIRRCADVIAMRPGRIDLDGPPKARALGKFPKHALGGRRAADIAHADEKNLDHAGFNPVLAPRQPW